MTQDFGRARTNMVENQVRTNDVTDLAVQDAMRVIPRERLCPSRPALAYAEVAVEYAPGLRLAEPRTVAKLLQAIAPQPGERALCLAAPYAAMILAQAQGRVTALQPPGAGFDAVSGVLGERGVSVLAGDLADLGDLGPFDVMICEAAVVRAPAAWTDRLAEGGRLGVVERTGPHGRARLYLRSDDGGLARRDVFDAQADWLPGFEPKAAFAL